VPFGAQVLAVVDTWAALTRPRPHRPALSEPDALAVLRREVRAGRLPGKLVDALERLVGAGGRTDPPGVTAEVAGLDVGPGVDEPGEPGPPMTVVQPATGRLALSL
jgi:hypothetical protein